MPTQGSVTEWLHAVELGDEDAAQRLWERYYSSLLRLARAKLTGHAGRSFDEQDIVLNAFEACYRGFQTGRFPHINDRHDLWKLLISLTARKAVDSIRRETRQKRGGGQSVLEADLLGSSGDSANQWMARVVGTEPSPEFAAMLAEDLQRRLDSLPNETLRSICLWKMEGWTNDEIAVRMDCTTRTVERKLELIRKHWQQEQIDVGSGDNSAI